MATGTFKRADVLAMCVRARTIVEAELAKLAKLEEALPRTQVNKPGTWRHWFFGPGGKVVDDVKLMIIQIDRECAHKHWAQINRIHSLCRNSDGDIHLTDEEYQRINP